MASRRELVVALISDSSQFSRGFDQAKRDVSGFSSQFEQSSKKLTGSIQGIAASFKGIALAAGGAALGQFFAESIGAARDLQESVNAVNTVFGDGAELIDDYGNTVAQTAGLSKREFGELATVTGALLQNVGFSAGAAAEETIGLTQRASDMASVFNTDVSTALEAVNSALKGEADPIERFGVKLNDATIRAKAVELGLADTTAAVDDHGKAVAALELIYEQTDKVAGDFLKTSDELANSQRRAAAEFENAQARIGEAAQPFITGGLNVASTVLQSFAALGGDEIAQAGLRMQEAINTISDASESGGDVFSALADGLLHVAVNGELTAGQFQALAGMAGLMPDQFDAFREAVVDQAEALGLDQEYIDELTLAMTTTAPEDFAGAIGKSGDAAATAADQIAAAASAQRDLRSAFLEAADPVFAAAAAAERLAGAKEALTAVEKDEKATADDLAQARLDVASAMLDMQVALDELDASDVDAALRTLATTMGIGTEEAAALLEQLGILDGMKVSTEVDISISRVSVSNRTGGVTEGLASGGPVRAGEAYMVGESGTELFVPQTAGQIIPNHQLAGIGATYNMSVPVYGDVTDRALQDIQTNLIVASVGRWAENH